MARSLSPDLLARLPPCAAVYKEKGAHPRYLGDAAIRAYRGRSLSDLLADIGEDAEAVVIHGGIGTLVMRAAGNEWTPAPTVASLARGVVGAIAGSLALAMTGDPVTVPGAVRAARLAACARCDLWDAGRCRSCGCVTAAKAALAATSCPMGRWP